ncbi:MAG: primase alpha helix C-terminal domain-containing protein [Clostridiales bacterium]|nr:primase alpha helix C-terminal domain-containing protein [Clostridiales bacterium]
MKFTLYRSDVIGNKANCVYPIKEEIMSAESLAQAAAYDHVCASYRDSRRGNRNFDCSDVIVMDLDNDHTDNPKAWITAERLDGILPDVSYALVPSRHHMEEKDGHAARPKWHVYFPVDLIADADEYAAMKREIQRRIPFFDPNALDAARFVFGSGKDGVIWHEGWMDIDDFLDETGGPEEDAGEEQHEARRGPITEGSRNNTLSRFAGRVIKRYGNSGRAHEIFMQEAGRCEPPLPDSELASIWASAVGF